MIDLDFDVPPFRLSGMVYGALLNHAGWLAALGDAVHQAPYKAPPRFPVLGVKPRNTLVGAGAAVAVPHGVPGLEIGASLALVIGRTACRVSEDEALNHVAGYTIACDLAVPHESHYRPAVRLRARDGFCPIGPRVVPRAAVAEADRLAIQVRVDGATVFESSTAGMLRSVARLLAEVSDFITLAPGDLLLLGANPGAPCAAAGQGVEVAIEGLGVLHWHLVGEAEAVWA